MRGIDMLFRMLRTQTSEHGTLRMGVAYDAGKDPALVKLANAMKAAGFAEDVTAKQLEAEKVAAEKLATASAQPSKPVSDKAAIKAAQDAQAQAEAEAAEAKAQAEALAARVAELEAQAAAQDAGQSDK